MWRRTIEASAIQEVHAVSSPANSTPATDGERVYVYFGSVGLLAFDWDGKLLWKHDMGTAKSPFGSGSSPVIASELVLISRDYPGSPYLLAVRRSDGEPAWKADLAPGIGGPKTSHATPVIWKDQIVLHRPGMLAGHSLSDGQRLWWTLVGGTGTSTPVASDEEVYVAVFGPGSKRIVDPVSFAEALEKYDADGSGKLGRAECPPFDLFIVKRDGVPDTVPDAHFTFKSFFRVVDQDKDGQVDEAEYLGIYERMKQVMSGRGGLTAIRSEGEGDLSLEAVRWVEPQGSSEVPSALAYRGRVYVVRNGGILISVDKSTGKVLFRGRIHAPGAYYSSPVAAGGRLVVASSEGVVTVLDGGETLEVLSNNDLGDPVFGTPAPMKNAIYVRSLNHLWAFGSAAK